MIEVNKNRTKTDEAWERLYARLDEDNLLTGAGRGDPGVWSVRARSLSIVLGHPINRVR